MRTSLYINSVNGDGPLGVEVGKNNGTVWLVLRTAKDHSSVDVYGETIDEIRSLAARIAAACEKIEPGKADGIRADDAVPAVSEAIECPYTYIDAEEFRPIGCKPDYRPGEP